jgi:hypothetical protein
LTKWPQNIPTSSIARPSKIYSNCDFWFEKIPSGIPGLDTINPDPILPTIAICTPARKNVPHNKWPSAFSKKKNGE